MAKEMGIDSPLLMFGDEDDFDNNTQRTVRKKSVKRSVRRTTMLPPELSKTLNETFKNCRQSSRLRNAQCAKNDQIVPIDDPDTGKIHLTYHYHLP